MAILTPNEVTEQAMPCEPDVASEVLALERHVNATLVASQRAHKPFPWTVDALRMPISAAAWTTVLAQLEVAGWYASTKNGHITIAGRR